MTQDRAATDSQTTTRRALTIGYLRTGVPLAAATQACGVSHEELVEWLNDDSFVAEAQEALEAHEQDLVRILMRHPEAFSTGFQAAENPGNTLPKQPT